MEKTLIIIKPDAMRDGVGNEIGLILKNAGLIMIASKTCRLSAEQAKAFYAIHVQKPFYNDLVHFMTSGEIMAQVLERENAVTVARNVIGQTNPVLADKGTIRELYGTSIDHNAIHGSDSVDNAEKEINFFFSGMELI